MPRNDRHYDYGLRGYDDVARSRFREERLPPPRYGEEFGRERRINAGRVPHVTARYNEDYLRGPSRRPGPVDWSGRGRQFIGGEPDDYRRPYITKGGTYTYRGSARPGYDYPDYGPNYGGRYPDEL